MRDEQCPVGEIGHLAVLRVEALLVEEAFDLGDRSGGLESSDPLCNAVTSNHCDAAERRRDLDLQRDRVEREVDEARRRQAPIAAVFLAALGNPNP